VEWYDAKIVTAHNHDPEIPFTELEKERKIAVLAGREGAMAWIARLAEAIGVRYDIYVCEDLSGEKEKITKATPQTLHGYAASTLTVVLFIGREIER
jgi:precorrin-6B methylase 1